MKNIRIYLLIISFVVFGYWWIHLKEQPSNRLITNKKSQLKSAEQLDKKISKALNNVSSSNQNETIDTVSICYNKILKKSGAESCDKNCYSRLLQAKYPDLSAFIEEDWLNAKKPPLHPKSKLGRFYKALALSGIELRNGLELESDYNKSLKMLQELKREDPQNALPALFYAYVLLKLGKTNEAEAALQDASRLQFYKSYMAEAIHESLLASEGDPRLYLKHQELRSLIPFPDFNPLKELDGLDDESFLRLGKLMTETGIKQPRGWDLTWSALEHQIGISFIRKFSPGDASNIPDYKELLQEQWDEDQVSVFDEECNYEKIQDWFKVEYNNARSLKGKI